MAFLTRKPRAAAMVERRRAPRIELKRASAKVDSKTFELKNVSATGFLLTSYEGDLIANQRMYLTLMLPVDGEEHDFLTDAQVVRVNERTLAGRFRNLRPDARRAIERLQAKAAGAR